MTLSEKSYDVTECTFIKSDSIKNTSDVIFYTLYSIFFSNWHKRKILISQSCFYSHMQTTWWMMFCTAAQKVSKHWGIVLTFTLCQIHPLIMNQLLCGSFLNSFIPANDQRMCLNKGSTVHSRDKWLSSTTYKILNMCFLPKHIFLMEGLAFFSKKTLKNAFLRTLKVDF